MRDPARIDRILNKLGLLWRRYPDMRFVSGGARGVDKFAERLARARGMDVRVIQPDWDTHGKRAGYLRNREIVEACQWVVAFWDGESKGTKHTIDLALKAKLHLTVFFP